MLLQWKLNVTKTSQNPIDHPQVYKEEEFGLMCGFVELGMWRTSNLSKACGVDRTTIEIWKKLPEAQKAYRKATNVILKKRKHSGDVEKLMKEMDYEVDKTELDITTQGQPIFGGKSVNALSANVSNT